MIYLLEKYCDMHEHYVVDAVYEVNGDVDAEYTKFMLAKAEEYGCVVNPHWLNLMNYADHHPNLSAAEYKEKERFWNKMLKMYTKQVYIEKFMRGQKLEFKTIYG